MLTAVCIGELALIVGGCTNVVGSAVDITRGNGDTIHDTDGVAVAIVGGQGK